MMFRLQSGLYEFIDFVKLSFNESTKFVKMEISDSEKKYARAALAVFQRYGVRKSTMEEIAAEAGVSKPTLYATYRNKDAALGGAIRLAKSEAINSVVETWSDVESTAEKLDIFCERLVLAGFDMLHQSPDASAFETALGDFSRDAIAATRKAEVDAIAGLFEGAQGLSEFGTNAAEFANFFVASAMNAKRQARTRAELETYLTILKSTVLKGLTV